MCATHTIDADLRNQLVALFSGDEVTKNIAANNVLINVQAVYALLAAYLSKPRFQHDCDHCTYLGSYVDGAQHYDLYHCDNNGAQMKGSLIARYGDEDYQNASTLVKLQSQYPSTDALGEAYRLYSTRIAPML